MLATEQVLTAVSPRVRSSSGLVPLGMTAVILIADVVSLFAVLALLVMVRHYLNPQYQWNATVNFLPFLFMIFPAFFFQGLYPGLLIHPAEEMRRVFYSLSGVFLIWATTAFLWRTDFLYSRSVFLAAWAMISPAILLSRLFARWWFRNSDWWGVPAVVLGSGPTAQRIVRKLRFGMLGIRVTGVFSENQILSWAHDMPPILGDLAAAPDVVGAKIARYAIVAVASQSNLELRHVIEDYCRGFGQVLLVPDLPDVCA